MSKQYCRVLYHVVWATLMRQHLIAESFKGQLHDFIRSKTRQMSGIPYAVGGVSDHVHCLIFIPPRVAVATFIGNLKGASSHWVNHHAKPGDDFAWQNGYGLFTISRDDQQGLVAYILNQELHHQRGTLRIALETMESEA